MKTTGKLSKLASLNYGDQEIIFRLCAHNTYSKVVRILAKSREEGGLGIKTNESALCRFNQEFGVIGTYCSAVNRDADALAAQDTPDLHHAIYRGVQQQIFKEVVVHHRPIDTMPIHFRVYFRLQKTIVPSRAREGHVPPCPILSLQRDALPSTVTELDLVPRAAHHPSSAIKNEQCSPQFAQRTPLEGQYSGGDPGSPILNPRWNLSPCPAPSPSPSSSSSSSSYEKIAHETPVISHIAHFPFHFRAISDRPNSHHLLRAMKLCLLSLGLLAAQLGVSITPAAILHGPVTNSANAHIYYLLAPNSWTTSEVEAAQLGGHLATVNDPAESLWLQETFGSWGGVERGLWIGLNDARLEGTFEWASTDPVNFRNWRRSFPIDPDGTADYAFIDFPSSIYTGTWRNGRNDSHDAPGLPISGVVEIAPANEPVLSMAREGKDIRIDFTGMLQRADQVTGPWTELTNAPSPYWIRPDANPNFSITAAEATTQRFFRTRGPESIFDRASVVSLSMEGPFQVYFEKAFAGMPDGIFPPVREKPWFEGEVALTAPGLERPIDVRVRGNSSLQECPFPKLKFKVSRTDRANTPFFNSREIKVGTHCAEGGRGTIGRLRDERATWREALVYEVMHTLDFVSPRVRRAQIQYRDTSPTNAVNGETGWALTRKAVLLDDIEVVAERLAGRALDDDEITNLTNANFGVQLIADLRILHAFLGNWDFALSVDGSNLWNTDVVALPDGSFIPVAGDFDLSSFVTEEIQLNAPWDYHPELPPLDRETRWRLDVIRQDVPADVFTAGKDRFAATRPAIEALIASALIDDAGRTNAQKHVTAFYTALEAIVGVKN